MQETHHRPALAQAEQLAALPLNSSSSPLKPTSSDATGMLAKSDAKRVSTCFVAVLRRSQLVGLGVQFGLVDAQVLGQLAQLGLIAFGCGFGLAQVAAGQGGEHLVLQLGFDVLGLAHEPVAGFDPLFQNEGFHPFRSWAEGVGAKMAGEP